MGAVGPAARLGSAGPPVRYDGHGLPVSVIVPLRPNSPERARAWAWCRHRWVDLIGDNGEIIEIDSGDEPFNRGRSINLGVRSATHPVLVIADADTVVSHCCVDAALDGHWSICHRRNSYFSLIPEGTLFVQACDPRGELPNPRELQFGWSPGVTSDSGVLTMPKAAFDHVGGMPEAFVGWGGEDVAFRIKMDKLWEPHRRPDGWALHLWHPRGSEYKSPGWPANAVLLDQYREWEAGTPGFDQPLE